MLFAKWKVENNKAMAEVFQILVTEKLLAKENSFKFENRMFECTINTDVSQATKALKIMNQAGSIVEFSYYDSNSEKNECGNLVKEENLGYEKVICESNIISDPDLLIESPDPSQELYEEVYSFDEQLAQIAENTVSYQDFATKVASIMDMLSNEHHNALIEMLLAGTNAKKQTMATLEKLAGEKVRINSYTRAKLAKAIKDTFECTPSYFFKKIISYVHNWDDKVSLDHAEETKIDDREIITTTIEHHDGILRCMLKPKFDKVISVEELENKLKQVAERSDISLQEKIAEVILVFAPSESATKFDSLSEKTAEILERAEISYDDNTPIEEKDVYLQWSEIASFVSKFYFGNEPKMPIQAKYFLLDLKRLLVK